MLARASGWRRREHSFPALFRAGLGELAGKFPAEKQWHAHPKKDREHSELRNTDIAVCIKKKGGNYSSQHFLNAKFGAPPPPTSATPHFCRSPELSLPLAEAGSHAKLRDRFYSPNSRPSCKFITLQTSCSGSWSENAGVTVPSQGFGSDLSPDTLSPPMDTRDL